MSGVAVTFLIIAAIFMVQAAVQKKKAQEAQKLAENASKMSEKDAQELQRLKKKDNDGIKELEALRAKLQANSRLKNNIELDYDPSKDPRLLTIVFSRDNLQFTRGDCVVDDSRKALLQTTLREIFPEVCAAVDKKFVQSIALEGHTDNLPAYGAKCGTEASSEDASCFANPNAGECKRRSFENNVRLSAARAQYVFFKAREALKADAAIAECLDKHFSISGRGPMEPVDGKPWESPRTDAENAANRRVVIKVRVMTSVAGEESK